MKVTAIAQHLIATQIESIEVWAKVLLVKAIVNGRTVVRFVSKKLIASEITLKTVEIRKQYFSEEYGHEYANKFGSFEAFAAIELRDALSKAIAKFNSESTQAMTEAFWLEKLDLSLEQFNQGCNVIHMMTRQQARKLFSSEEKMSLFLEAASVLRPWIEVLDVAPKMTFKKFSIR